MSWVNDKPNLIRDYLNLPEIFTRPTQLSPTQDSDRDLYHGRAVTTLEESLDSALFSAFTNIGVGWAKDPLLCRPEQLPSLAFEHGVSGWYGGVSVSEQRDIVANSKSIHRKAGTITGIAEAIKSLGMNVTVARSQVPYRLTVLTQTALTEALSRQVFDRVTNYKSERDSLSIEAVASSVNINYFGTGSLITVGIYSSSEGKLK